MTKIDTLRKINKNIVHDDGTIDSFERQLIDFMFGEYDYNYPFVISATRIDTDEAVQQTVRYINDKDVLSKAYWRMMPEINEKLENVKKQIKGIMIH